MAAMVLLKSMIFATALRKDRKKKKTVIDRTTDKYNGCHRCRICNKEKARISIFNNERKRNIAQEIESFSGVIITKNDIHPKYICQHCLDLLNSCILFRKTCQRTQKLFNEQPKPVIKIETKNDKNSESDYDPNNDDGGSTSDDFGETFTAQLDVQGTVQEKQTCAECCHDYADEESYNWHLPFCEARHEEINKPIKKETGEKRLKADKSTEIKKHLCDTCGKTLSNKHVLIQHMTTHTNVFPFKCPSCPYRGRTADLLRTHKRSHLADKPYKCALCPKTTTTCSNLRRHVLTQHRAPSHVKCTYCDKSFTNNTGLKKHVTDIHMRQAGGYECDICLRKYSTRKILLGHRRKVHKVRLAVLGRLPSYLQHQMEEEQGSHRQEMEGNVGEE